MSNKKNENLQKSIGKITCSPVTYKKITLMGTGERILFKTAKSNFHQTRILKVYPFYKPVSSFNAFGNE